MDRIIFLMAESFPFLKGALFTIVLIVVSLFQLYIPWDSGFRLSGKNYFRNLSMGIFNYVLLFMFFGSSLFVFSSFVQEKGWGLFPFLSFPANLSMILTPIIMDLFTYLWHRLNHKIPFLWRFHSIHHSDLYVDASTSVRFHFVEILLSLIFRLSLVAIFGLPLVGLMLFELLYFAFNIFEHGNLRLPSFVDRALRIFWITPALHRLHHSVDLKHLNANFGTIFSLWDRVFGSFLLPDQKKHLPVGLAGSLSKNFRLLELLVLPFSSRWHP